MKSVACCFILFLPCVSQAFAIDCTSQHNTCTKICAGGTLLLAVMAGKSNGNYDPSTVSNCLEKCEGQNNTCLASEAASQEQVRQAANQAAINQEISESRQAVQKANSMASAILADSHSRHRVDESIKLGMDALAAKAYVSAESNFKAALLADPSNTEAKKGVMQSMQLSGDHAGAIAYAAQELMATAAIPPNPDRSSRYSVWVKALQATGTVSSVEGAQLLKMYPFSIDDPELAALNFEKSFPKSALRPYAASMGNMLPALRAELADRGRSKTNRNAQAMNATQAVSPIASTAKPVVDQAGVVGRLIPSTHNSLPQVDSGITEKEVGFVDSHKGSIESIPRAIRYALLGRWRTTNGYGVDLVHSCSRYHEIIEITEHAMTFKAYGKIPNNKIYTLSIETIEHDRIIAKFHGLWTATNTYSIDGETMTINYPMGHHCKYFRAPIGGPEPPIIR